MANLKAIIKAAGGELEANSKTHHHRIRIQSSSSDRTYIVSMRVTTKKWECSCPGWIHHRKCKHLKTMMPTLELIAGDKKALKA